MDGFDFAGFAATPRADPSPPAAAGHPAVPAWAAMQETQVDEPDAEAAAGAIGREHGEGSPAARTPMPVKRQASDAGLDESPYRSIHERLQGYSPRQSAAAGRLSAAGSPAGSTAGGYAATNPNAADSPAARTNELFNRSWQAWVAALQTKTGEYLDPEFTDRIMQQPLWRAQKILSKVSAPNIERPVGYLVYMLREAEGGQPPKSAEPAQRALPARPAAAPTAGPSRSASSMSAQPSDDPLRTVLPLAVVDRGEAGNMAAESLFCMSCSLRSPYRRRATRASGLDQPLSLHRFVRCGCGAHGSIVMHEHFAGVYLLTMLMTRPAPPTSAQPSLVPTQLPAHVERASDAASTERPIVPVPRYPVEDVRCAGCGSRLQLIAYDPIDHVFHMVEYGCPACQEIYGGTCAASGDRLMLSVLRTRPSQSTG